MGINFFSKNKISKILKNKNYKLETNHKMSRKPGYEKLLNEMIEQQRNIVNRETSKLHEYINFKTRTKEIIEYDRCLKQCKAQLKDVNSPTVICQLSNFYKYGALLEKEGYLTKRKFDHDCGAFAPPWIRVNFKPPTEPSQ